MFMPGKLTRVLVLASWLLLGGIGFNGGGLVGPMASQAGDGTLAKQELKNKSKKKGKKKKKKGHKKHKKHQKKGKKSNKGQE